MSQFLLSLFGVAILGLLIDVVNTSSSKMADSINFIFGLIILIIVSVPILQTLQHWL